MYCGHCGAAVGERDVFCNVCGARFVDATEAAPDPWAPTGAAPAAPTAAYAATGATMAAAPPGLAEPTRAIPTTPAGPPPPPPPGVEGPPTAFVPLTPGPGRGGWRPFAIGAAFALIVLAGVFAYVALRDDEPGAAPDPSGPSVLSATTTTTIVPTTTTPTTLPPTTAAPTVAPTEAPTVPPTEAPTTTGAPAPATTGAGPTPTVAPITVVTTAPAATVAPVPSATTPAAPATTARPTTAPTTAAPATTVATAGNVPASMSPTVAAVRSSATRQNSVDSCGKPTNYGPLNALDGTNATAWMTVGSGDGQYVEFTLRKGVEISTVGLVPGYAKVDPCTGQDRFLDMRRIAEVVWTFDGGDEIVQQLDVESGTMQTMDLPAPIAASKVRMTIRVTTPPGTAGFDYAPVSEVNLS